MSGGVKERQETKAVFLEYSPAASLPALTSSYWSIPTGAVDVNGHSTHTLAIKHTPHDTGCVPCLFCSGPVGLRVPGTGLRGRAVVRPV